MPSRHWRAVIIVGCTLLLTLPLYQLRDHQAAGYYKQYIYDHLSPYLQGPGVYNNTLYHEGTEAAVHEQWNFSSPCRNFPNMDKIMLVMKTGATEAFDKLPTQLLTGLQCIDDFLIFSDLVSLCFWLDRLAVAPTLMPLCPSRLGSGIAHPPIRPRPRQTMQQGFSQELNCQD
jgi:hypothetical protein